MKPPARITDRAAGGLGASLVRSARADAPPANSRRRAIAAAAIAGAKVSSMSGGAAAGGAVAGAALAKWLAWGVSGLVLAVGIGAAVVAGTDKSGEPATPVATVVAASPRSMVPPYLATPTDPPAALLPAIVAVPVESLPSAPVRARAPMAAPREVAPVADAPAARSTLTQEIALLDGAKRALDPSETDAALVILDRHAREFPRGALVPEATALRIEALYRQGDRAAAATLFRRFDETNPTSPVLDHVRPFARSTPKAD